MNAWIQDALDHDMHERKDRSKREEHNSQSRDGGRDEER